MKGPVRGGPQLVFEKSADDNLAIVHSRGLMTDNSLLRSNRLIAFGAANSEGVKQAPSPAGSN